MNNVFSVRKLTLLVLFLLLSACGGSGESSSKAAIETPPTSGNTNLNQKALIDLDSANIALIHLASTPEALLQLAELYISEFNILSLKANSQDNYFNCGLSGSAGYIWQDLDTDQTFSTDDKLEISFDDCKSSSLDSFITGSSLVTVISKSNGHNKLLLDFKITSSDYGSTVPVNGSFTLDYFKNNDNEILEITNIEQSLNITIEGSTEEFYDFFITKKVNNYANYSIDYNFKVKSTLAKGILECRSVEAVKGIIYGLPYQFSASCSGSEQGEVSLLMRPSSSFDLYATYSSSDGQEKGSESFSSKTFFEKVISNPIRKIDYETPNDKTIHTLQVDEPNQLTPNKKGTKAYLAGYDEIEEKNLITEIDLQTMTEVRTIFFSQEKPYILNMATAEDAKLYIETYGVYPNHTIRQLNLDTFQFTDFDFLKILEESNLDIELRNLKFNQFSTTSSGDLIISITENHWINSTKQLLLIISEGQIVSYLEQDDVSYRPDFYLTKNDELYQISSDSYSNEKIISRYSVKSGEFELLNSINLNTKWLNEIKHIENNFLYSADGEVVNLSNGEIEKDLNFSSDGNDLFYIPSLNIAFKFSQGISYSSLDNGEKLAGIKAEQDSPMLYSQTYYRHLIDNKYFLFVNKKSSFDSDVNTYELIKAPITELLW